MTKLSATTTPDEHTTPVANQQGDTTMSPTPGDHRTDQRTWLATNPNPGRSQAERSTPSRSATGANNDVESVDRRAERHLHLRRTDDLGGGREARQSTTRSTTTSVWAPQRVRSKEPLIRLTEWGARCPARGSGPAVSPRRAGTGRGRRPALPGEDGDDAGEVRPVGTIEEGRLGGGGDLGGVLGVRSTLVEVGQPDDVATTIAACSPRRFPVR